MRRFLVPLCLGLVVLTACAAFERTAGGGKSDVETIVDNLAPMLPPPFGLIAGGLATILSGFASVGANKASNTAFKKKEKASLLVRLATDHASTIMTAALPTLIALRASGAIHFSDGELTLLSTAFGTPIVTKKVMRRKTT